MGTTLQINAAKSQSLESLLEASQALSREINLDRLIEKMMRIVLEHANAERGFLLQYIDSKLLIQAKGKPVDRESEFFNQSHQIAAIDFPLKW